MPIAPILSNSLDVCAKILTQVQVPAEFDAEKKPIKWIPLITKAEFGNLKAIAGYCKRDGFCGAIATVIHRIWNFVKGIFGQSDWQVAERTMFNIVKRIAVGSGGYDEALSAVCKATFGSKKCKKRISEMMDAVVSKINALNKLHKPLDKVIIDNFVELCRLIEVKDAPKTLYDLNEKISGIGGSIKLLLKKLDEEFFLFQIWEGEKADKLIELLGPFLKTSEGLKTLDLLGYEFDDPSSSSSSEE